MQVAGYVFQSITAFTKWGSLSDAQRAIVIISTIGMVIDVAAKSFELFLDVKKWNANRKDIPLTNEESLKGQVLDDETTALIQSDKGIEDISEANEKATQDKSLRDSYEEIREEMPQDTASAGIIEDGINEIKPAETILSDIEKEPPSGVPVAARGQWKAFTTSEKVLKCANIAVGVAFTIAMSIDLKNNWEYLNDTGKALNVIQIVIQGLTVLIDAALLIGDAAIAAGLLAADSVMMVALPVLGAILAVIGIVVMALLSFLNVTKPKEPPKTPVETFIDDTARPLIKVFLPPPPLSLTYTIPSSIPANQSTPLTITATNNTGKGVTLARSTITLEVGDDDAALFSAPTAEWAVDDAYGTASPIKPLSKAGSVGAAPSSLSTALITYNPRTTSLSSYDVMVLGKSATTSSDAGPLVLAAGEKVQISWLGTVNKAGSTTLQIVETLLSGDNCRLMTPITRS